MQLQIAIQLHRLTSLKFSDHDTYKLIKQIKDHLYLSDSLRLDLDKRNEQKKNVLGIIDRAYDILQKKGAQTCQEHCFVETGANLKWSCAMADKPTLDNHKVRKQADATWPNIVN